MLHRTIKDVCQVTDETVNLTAWGGSAYPWHSGHVISSLVVGFIALIAFVIYGE